MDGQNTPIDGWAQPTHGSISKLIFDGVGKAKTPKVISWEARKAREALGRGLLRELAKAFPHKSKTFGFEQVKADTGLSLSTLQRIADGKVGPSIDTLAAIAKNLGCSVPDLFDESKDGLPGTVVVTKQSLQRRAGK